MNSNYNDDGSYKTNLDENIGVATWRFNFTDIYRYNWLSISKIS